MDYSNDNAVQDLTVDVPVADTTAIMDELRDQANAILSAAHGVTLEGFHVGALGNFPYTWQDPSSLDFNVKTYDWISSALAARNAGEDISLDGNFTNEYLKAIKSISYFFSKADQVKLNEIAKKTTQQSAAILTAWKAAFGSLPTEKPVIDEIIKIIRTEWATDPATTLDQMQNSKQLSKLLGNTPPAGKTIIPIFANYLSAIGSGISLVDAATFYSSLLRDIENAILNPTLENGGVQVNNDSIRPAYPVATQQSDILNGLENKDNSIELAMTVSKFNSNEVSVSVKGGAGFTVPVLDFFTLGAKGSASYFKDEIVQTSSSIEINMEYTGVTMVEFGPKQYDISSVTGWMDASPVRDAVANAENDITGFKFSPASSVDFSENGPFGYLTAVGISNYPAITIKATSSSYQSIAESFQQESSWSVGFLGIELASLSQSYSASSVSVNASEGSVTITLTPPAEVVAGTAVDSVGFVLGVQAEYPVG